MEITPKKENPEKPLENVGNYAAPHLSKPASLLNNDKTYTSLSRLTNSIVDPVVDYADNITILIINFNLSECTIANFIDPAQAWLNFKVITNPRYVTVKNKKRVTRQKIP